MKKTILKLLSCGFLVIFSVILLGATFVWKRVWRSVGLRAGETCLYSLQPVSKGTFWNRGEWHHYVDFAIDIGNPREYRWRLTRAPLPSSILRLNAEEDTLRVTYRWPSNWADPFSMDRWEVCFLDSQEE
ncbi:MAG: hypothetical protein HZB18_14285 [Chloroflexi bacterium]|nr:hypothetical protein [Chloroflexota bacterium]